MRISINRIRSILVYVYSILLLKTLKYNMNKECLYPKQQQLKIQKKPPLAPLSTSMQSNPIPAFMRYQPDHLPLREAYLKRKSVPELRKIPMTQIQSQFKVLSYVDVPDEAFNLANSKKNRYIDILAYQHSRVKIQHIPNYYINANQVKSLVDGNVFAVFSQAPIKDFDNFWQAVYYKDITIVIMLCSFYDPKRGQQSQQYWPNPKQQTVFSAQKITVRNMHYDNTDQQYVVNKFQMQGPKGTKHLTHIHWMGWSDLKKPVESNMKRFQEILEICLKEIEDKKLIWIHCSAGIGRTGTLGGVIEAIRLYRKQKCFSIFEIVENMRKYRYHAVQTSEQYKFLYQYLCKKLS